MMIWSNSTPYGSAKVTALHASRKRCISSFLKLFFCESSASVSNSPFPARNLHKDSSKMANAGREKSQKQKRKNLEDKKNPKKIQNVSARARRCQKVQNFAKILVCYDPNLQFTSVYRNCYKWVISMILRWENSKICYWIWFSIIKMQAKKL